MRKLANKSMTEDTDISINNVSRRRYGCLTGPAALNG